jgi:hypothetical protein
MASSPIYRPAVLEALGAWLRGWREDPHLRGALAAAQLAFANTRCFGIFKFPRIGAAAANRRTSTERCIIIPKAAQKNARTRKISYNDRNWQLRSANSLTDSFLERHRLALNVSAYSATRSCRHMIMYLISTYSSMPR